MRTRRVVISMMSIMNWSLLRARMTMDSEDERINKMKSEEISTVSRRASLFFRAQFCAVCRCLVWYECDWPVLEQVEMLWSTVERLKVQKIRHRWMLERFSISFFPPSLFGFLLSHATRIWESCCCVPTMLLHRDFLFCLFMSAFPACAMQCNAAFIYTFIFVQLMHLIYYCDFSLAEPDINTNCDELRQRI